MPAQSMDTDEVLFCPKKQLLLLRITEACFHLTTSTNSGMVSMGTLYTLFFQNQAWQYE